MSDVPVWSCEVQPAPHGPPLDQLTVGAKFLLKCHGDLAVAWTADPVHVKFPKDEQNFALNVLNADQLSAQSVQLTVTGYRPGEQTPDWIRVLQGDHGFEVEKPKWAVTSVVKEGAKPYPSFGPWGLGLPTFLWVTAAVLLALAVGLAIWALRRVTQRRRVREAVQRHRTALAPAHQFYKDARTLRRRLNEATAPEVTRGVALDLARDFRTYLTREFEVPALEWSDAAIRRDVARRHRDVHAAAGDALAKALRELTRLSARAATDAGDVEQILNMSLAAVEEIEGAK